MSRRYWNVSISALAAWLLSLSPWALSSQEATQLADGSSWSPEWTKDLVIYNVATKAFTSPNGPESGTFDGLRAKMPYLQELGVTGIWISGHSLADPHHFFNVWTQYACIEPDKLDPSLGTAEQFKAMIDEAHRHGIKIFLDVITHGLMAYSPLVKQHPHWFRGGSWGMIDYDWTGGHVDLDEWWVNIWTDAVVQYGVDGFRIDLGIGYGNQGRYDLWARIRKNGEAAGHPIAIMEEGRSVVPGLGALAQGQPRISNPVAPNDYHALFMNNVPLYYDYHFGRSGGYEVKIEYEDGTSAKGVTAKAGDLEVRSNGLTLDRASARLRDPVIAFDPFPSAQKEAQGVPRADGIPDVQLTVSKVAAKAIKNITVTLDDGSVFPKGLTWTLHGNETLITMEGEQPSIKIYVPTLSYNSSLQLSAIDEGWWNSDENPYVAQGSRATFGYSFLFTPRIPIFMAGEEFDATFRPVPGLTTDTVDHKDKGKGKILLGSMLDWNELKEPRHREMLDDVKRMLALRRREANVLTPQVRGDIEPQLVAVPYKADINVPVPYMRWKDSTAVVVMANRYVDADAHLKLNLPIEKMGAPSAARYKVTDLWRGKKPRVYAATALARLSYTVKRDKTPQGGIGLLKIEPVQ